MKPEKLPSLSEVIKTIGVQPISAACGCSPRAIYKWIEKGSLPRTDFTGETHYAEQIACASAGKYSAELIKQISCPQKVNQSAA